LRDKKVLLPYQRKWVNDMAPVKVWVASRQIGKSFALSLEAVTEALMGRSDNLILSSSERQAQEIMTKVRKHLSVKREMSQGELTPVKETREEIEFQTGSRIISLPANPATVRGFSGNVYLDEFAFHMDSREIWRAMYPTVTRGYKVRVTSTPNGRQNMFYELASGSGGVGNGPGVSRHRTDIHMAVRDGLDIDVEALRTGIADPEAWAQEYECNFLDTATALIPYEMIEACTSPDATLEPLVDCTGETYMGMDIGRKHDLTVFWLLEKVGDVLWTRAVREMRNAAFAAQRNALYQLMESCGVRRACMDSTGIGSQLSEEAAGRFGQRVEPVKFTQATKEDMALRARRAFEERGVRVPVDRRIREDLHSLSRSVGVSGAVRYGAARTRHGHADRFWALALALEAAASGGAAPVEYASVEGRGRAGGPRGW